MESITLPNNNIVFTDTRLQVSPSGKEFVSIGISKDLTKPEKWLKKSGHNVICWHWVYHFKYIDGSGYFDIEINYNDEFFKLNKHV